MAENPDQNPAERPEHNDIEQPSQQPSQQSSRQPEASRRGMKKALLIGVSQYSSGWQPLPAAKGDVERLQQLLMNPNIGNFDDVKLLLNPDRQHLEEEVYALAVNSQRHDLVLVYFSGWGAREATGKLYLTTAITRKDPSGELNKLTAVLLTTIQELLNHSAAEQQVVILDSCFEDAFGGAFEGTVDAIAPSDSHANSDLDTKAQIGGENRAVLTAASSTVYTSAQKQADCSLYSGYLIEGMETGAASRAVNQITLQDLHQYARRRVQAATPAIEPELYLPRPEFDVVLTQAPTRNAQMLYRQHVESHSHSGEQAISDFDRLILNWRRDRLGLSPDTTAEVEKAVLKPYQACRENLQRYRQKLATVVSYQYPLRANTLNQLERLRQRLGLLIDQTGAIATETIVPYEQQYQQHLQQFEQHFTRELEQGGYPLDRQVRNEIRYLEQQLHLKARDVAAIQQRVIAEYQERYRQQLGQYEQSLRQAIERGYPLDDRTRHELRRQQQSSRLQDEDVAAIEADMLAQLHLGQPESPESPYGNNGQEAQPVSSAEGSGNLEAAGDRTSLDPEEYQKNIHQYRQYFISKFQPSQPLDDQTLSELESLQSVLRLKEADVAQAEAEGTQEKLDDDEQKLQQYEREFYRLAETDSSDSVNRDRLKHLQQMGVSDRDVALVEKIALELFDRGKTSIVSSDAEALSDQTTTVQTAIDQTAVDQTAVDQTATDQTATDHSDRKATANVLSDLSASGGHSSTQTVSEPTEPERSDRPNSVSTAGEPVDSAAGSPAAQTVTGGANTQLQPPIADAEVARTVDGVNPQPEAAIALPRTSSARGSRPGRFQPDDLSPRASRMNPTAVASSPINTAARQPLIEQLRNPASRLSAVLQIFRSLGLAVLAIAVGRILITQLLRLLPNPIGQALGLILFALSILLAWKALNLLN